MKIRRPELKSMQTYYKQFSRVTPAQIGFRSRVGLSYGLDRAGRFTAVVDVERKSRIVQKDVETFEAIADKLSVYCDQPFEHKVLLLRAPVCSKARARLETLGWEVIDHAAV